MKYFQEIDNLNQEIKTLEAFNDFINPVNKEEQEREQQEIQSIEEDLKL